MRSYVVVDLEMCVVPLRERTASFGCTNEIIQIGAVLLDEDLEICDTFKTYVRPQYGELDEVITNLTGITNRDLENAPDCEAALTELMKWAPENARMVAWSENDEIQIRRETRAKNISVAGLKDFMGGCIDCQKTFGEIMFSKRCYNLTDALSISDIDYDTNAHDALVDAKNTALLFAKMEREKDGEFKLSPYISIGAGTSSGFTPFADLFANYSFA